MLSVECPAFSLAGIMGKSTVVSGGNKYVLPMPGSLYSTTDKSMGDFIYFIINLIVHMGPVKVPKADITMVRKFAMHKLMLR